MASGSHISRPYGLSLLLRLVYPTMNYLRLLRYLYTEREYIITELLLAKIDGTPVTYSTHTPALRGLFQLLVRT